MTLLTRVPSGRPPSEQNAVPNSMPLRRSAALARLPTHTTISAALSMMKTSSDVSISLCSLPRPTSVVVIAPDASLTRISRSSPLASEGVLSHTAAATGPRPPSAVQNSSGSSPCSQVLTVALPPLSLFRMSATTSSALAFSRRLASAPFHWMRRKPKSRTKTSPAFRDAARMGTTVTRTVLAPLRWSSLVS